MSSFLRILTPLTKGGLHCPRCEKPFTLPVTLRCGHNFCKVCIERHLETKDTCPAADCNKQVPAHEKCNLAVNLSLKGFVDKAYPSPHVASSAPAPPPTEGEVEESVLLRAMSLNTTLSLECFCKDPMTDPVTLPCGHNFCKGCIRQWFARSNFCPQCKFVISEQRFRGKKRNKKEKKTG